MKKLTNTILGLSILASSALATDITKLYAEDYNERIQVENNSSVPALSNKINNIKLNTIENNIFTKYSEDYNERIQVSKNTSVPALSNKINNTKSNTIENNIFTKYAEGYNERTI